MSTDQQFGSLRTAVVGAIGGGFAWMLGYALTYATVAGDVSESSLTEFIEMLEGRPAIFEQVGWIFFNAHGVSMVARDVPFVGRTSRTFIGGEDGFTVWLYAIPIVILVLLGLFLGYRFGAGDPLSGALAGLTIVPGYLFLTAAGIFLFAVQIGGATAEPDPIPGLFLAGIVWPTVLSGMGGAIGAALERFHRAS